MKEALKILEEIIKENLSESIWTDSPVKSYRSLGGNTNRGEVGEEFVRRYLQENGIKTGNGNRTSPTDMGIVGKRFEIKTASLGVNKTFQFNHIRLDKPYSYLLCIGICPRQIVFDAWSKDEVKEEKAGKLVRMAEGQEVTGKLTKPLKDMRKIEELPGWIRSRVLPNI